MGSKENEQAQGYGRLEKSMMVGPAWDFARTVQLINERENYSTRNLPQLLKYPVSTYRLSQKYIEDWLNSVFVTMNTKIVRFNIICMAKGVLWAMSTDVLATLSGTRTENMTHVFEVLLAQITGLSHSSVFGGNPSMGGIKSRTFYSSLCDLMGLSEYEATAIDAALIGAEAAVNNVATHRWTVYLDDRQTKIQECVAFGEALSQKLHSRCIDFLYDGLKRITNGLTERLMEDEVSVAVISGQTDVLIAGTATCITRRVENCQCTVLITSDRASKYAAMVENSCRLYPDHKWQTRNDEPEDHLKRLICSEMISDEALSHQRSCASVPVDVKLDLFYKHGFDMEAFSGAMNLALPLGMAENSVLNLNLGMLASVQHDTILSGRVIVNPPFTEVFVNLACAVIRRSLDSGDNDLTCMLVLPNWTRPVPHQETLLMEKFPPAARWLRKVRTFEVSQIKDDKGFFSKSTCEVACCVYLFSNEDRANDVKDMARRIDQWAGEKETQSAHGYTFVIDSSSPFPSVLGATNTWLMKTF